MDVKRYFTYTPELELIVAQIGITKWNWVSIDSEKEEKAKEVMRSNRFDILPISKGDESNRFFATKNWGDYDEIQLLEVTERDKLYYRLSFIDLLRRMRQDGRNYYFLADSEQVLGLLSLNNLNSLAVYNYIYQITAALERVVSTFLREILTEEEAMAILKKTSDQQAKESVKAYQENIEGNLDNSIFEHLYFPTLATLLKYAKPKLSGEREAILNYRKKFCPGQLYHRIRNKVSHPVRPLFSNKESVDEVYELISDYIAIKRLIE